VFQYRSRTGAKAEMGLGCSTRASGAPVRGKDDEFVCSTRNCPCAVSCDSGVAITTSRRSVRSPSNRPEPERKSSADREVAEDEGRTEEEEEGRW